MTACESQPCLTYPALSEPIQSRAREPCWGSLHVLLVKPRARPAPPPPVGASSAGLTRRGARYRFLGSAALCMCLVAEGAADVYYTFGVYCWDVAAGCVICREAGVSVLDTAGTPRQARRYTPARSSWPGPTPCTRSDGASLDTYTRSPGPMEPVWARTPAPPGQLIEPGAVKSFFSQSTPRDELVGYLLRCSTQGLWHD